MIGDLDHFKQINDKISHAVGDEVLRLVAKLIQDNTRKSDVIARYGGEEFVVAFVECGLEQAAQSCEKLRDFIQNYPWQNIHPELKVTMSMGLCDDTTLGSVEQMLGMADEMLYRAKKGGRNRVMPDPPELVTG